MAEPDQMYGQHVAEKMKKKPGMTCIFIII